MRLARISRAECDVELSRETAAVVPHESPQITLLQCLPKGRKIDLIIRQATEAGVSRIVLLVSDRCIARASEDAGRLARLEKIAKEALQQSGNARLPVIEAPQPLASLGDTEGEWGTALLFHEERLSESTLHELLAEPAERISILIGPEGGLSPSEVELLARAGFHAARLGGAVLRVETAAIFAIAAVRTIVQERNAWRAAEKR
jgi:16S rRNA (uracil1498-N3)-methyltransferase